MSALPHHRGYQVVVQTLADIDRSYRNNQLLTGAVATLGLAAGAVLCAALLAGLLPLAVAARLMLLVFLLAIPAAAIVVFVLPAVFRRRGERQMARMVEEAIPELRNGLINTVQLAHDPLAAKLPLTARAIEEASSVVSGISADQVISRRALTRWFLLTTLFLAGNGLYVAVAHDTYGTALKRVFHPSAFVPFVGDIKILQVTPGDTEVYRNDLMEVTVQVDNPERRGLLANLCRLGENGAIERFEMLPYGVGRKQFRFEFRSVPDEFRYYVQVGDSQSKIFTVTLRERVAIKGLDVIYQYPRYTGLDARTDANAKGPVEAPVGTTVRLRLRVASAIPSARIETGDGQLIEMEKQGYGFQGKIVVKKDSVYAIVVLDGSNRLLARLPARLPETGDPDPNAVRAHGDTDNGKADVQGSLYYPIRAIADKPPRAFFRKPAKDISAGPGSELEIVVEVKDDYGVGKIALFMSKGKNGKQETLKKETCRGKESALNYKLTIDKAKYKEGDLIVLQASAWDNRDLERAGLGGPQQVESNQVHVRVEDPERLARERAKRLAELSRRIEAILKLQISTKADTIRAKHVKGMGRFKIMVLPIVKGQQQVHADLMDLGEKFNFDAELVDTKRAILLLAHNEAVEAGEATKALKQVASVASVEPQCDVLVRVQQKIVSVLETLLGVVNAAKNGQLDGEPGKLGGDMPPELQEKLRKLAEELQRFLDEQKRMVKATAHLAKKPVDDYSERELERLKELEAVADEWDKFLQEAISDFSKMAEQDFSNPSLLQELIEIHDDVVMAKDALAKKAVEIAVPLEESGLEMAEELETNLERWLPDEPDRIKWSMEEPVGEFDAPMAELPKELTDLVGDLLEEEEDLFDEMQDVTSAWTDSLDKGAGWDALDGPISNMSARGVTGNQLPNKSEISGRSGEGRTGKSVGEIVEKNATGKGGRRTPTRLSHDAFQKGEINDTSKDPGGGATGGGKIGGLSGDGLEGPVPPELQKQLGRLAKKQATLRNKGEKIGSMFKAKNFDKFKLNEALIMMGHTADDLVAGRYRNALRRRTVIVDGLNTTQVLLNGHVKVRTDESMEMSKRDRDLIADAMKAELPRGYRQDVKQYLANLSERAAQE